MIVIVHRNLVGLCLALLEGLDGGAVFAKPKEPEIDVEAVLVRIRPPEFFAVIEQRAPRSKSKRERRRTRGWM